MNTLELNSITGCGRLENQTASVNCDPEQELIRRKRESRVKNERVDFCRRSQRALLAACGLWLATPSTSWGQVVMHFSSPAVVSPSSPSLTFSVENSDPFNPMSIGGVSLSVKVQAGGPTMSTASGTGVDLLTGTLFSTITTYGQFPVGTPTSLEQGWGVMMAFGSPAASLGLGETKQLATITFNSFPAGGWLVDFADTAFFDGNGEEVAVNHLLGTVTVVPEPQSYALAFGFGMLAFALARRFRPQWRCA